MKNKVGEIRRMNNGLNATIIAYRGCFDMDVQFDNGAIRRGVKYQTYELGHIRCPMIYEHIKDYVRVINPNTDADTFIDDVISELLHRAKTKPTCVSLAVTKLGIKV